jgi:Uma2 family endonuclease
MAIKERRRLSLEAFAALPEEKPALELEPDGTVTQKVSPKAQHSRLQYALAQLFNGFAEPKKLAAAFPELRATIATASYVPDIAVYRWARIRRTAEGEISNDPPDPPDIAVEIVSPEQRVTPLVRKCVWYVEHGVAISMLVDPGDQSVLLFRADAAPRVLRNADKIEIPDVLPGLELTVDQLFGTLRLD